MTKSLRFCGVLLNASICSLLLLPACSDDPVAPPADSGVDAAIDSGGGDGGPRDLGNDDGGDSDLGGDDGGDSDLGGDDGGPGDAGACVVADCDDGNLCNGTEICAVDGTCGAGTAAADGTACDIDSDPATLDLCVAGLCGPSRCGDGFTDTGEDCDDANDINGDGCDACVFSCTAAADCDDASVCTGVESCGADHVCAAGTPPADGTTCGGANICMGGFCVPPTCTVPADCDNALRCDGVETCAAPTCGSGPPPDCADASDCTADSCTEAGATMCLHTLIDADGDGFAATTLGACGTDCDDTVATTNTDAVDVCGDGIDNNCNGTIDEGVTTAYYADCDGDGYAIMGAAAVDSCAPPASSLTGCAVGGAWTTRAPTTAMDSDCNDANPAVNPGQTVYQTTAIAGEPVASDFDYDCNMVETRQNIVRGGCMRVGIGCLYTAGWQLGAGATAPLCGVEGTFIDGCIGMTCVEQTTMRAQSCL